MDSTTAHGNIGWEKKWPEWEKTDTLGKGGFGTVYEASKTDGSGDYSAIKVITIDENTMCSDAICSQKHIDDMKTRLLDEIKYMCSLKTASNIVHIEDHFVDEFEIDGRKKLKGYKIFIRMELLTPLKKLWYDTKAIKEDDVIKMGIDICTALEICHKKKIIHRDIKPANILTSDAGNGRITYKLSDFGIARQTDTANEYTSMIGTPNFIAPEVERKGGKYDHRADIYSLGLVLYYYLNAGNLPFLDPDRSLIGPDTMYEAKEKRISGKGQLPAPKNASPAMTEVLLKACNPVPQKRFQNAAQFREALCSVTEKKRFAQTDTVYVNPTSTDSSCKPARKKKRWYLCVFAFLLLIGLLAGVYKISSYYHDKHNNALSNNSLSGEAETTESTQDSTNVTPESNHTISSDAIYTDIPSSKTETSEPLQDSSDVTSENEHTTPPNAFYTGSPESSEPEQIVYDGSSMETAAPISTGTEYFIERTDGQSEYEEWFRFRTGNDMSVYELYVSEGYITGLMSSSVTLLDGNYTKIYYSNSEGFKLLLEPNADYWIRFWQENRGGYDKTYSFGVSEQPCDAGITKEDAFEIELGVEYKKTIEIRDMPDWFRFTTTDNYSVYRFYADNKINENPVDYLKIGVYDNRGVLVEEYSVSQAEEGDFFELYLQPCTDYYVRFSGYDGDYKMSVTEKVATTGLCMEEATAIELGKEYEGNLVHNYGNWYVVDVESSSTYNIVVHNAGVNGALSVSIGDEELMSSSKSINMSESGGLYHYSRYNKMFIVFKPYNKWSVGNFYFSVVKDE